MRIDDSAWLGIEPELTPEEYAEIATYFRELAEGKTCPTCHTAIASKRQYGRGIYAVPCGCRLYQGQLSKTARGTWKRQCHG